MLATERTLSEMGDKAPADLKAQIETAIAAVKTAMEGDDTARIKSATEELQQLSYKLGEALYAQSSAGDGATGGGNGFHPGEGAEQAAGHTDDVIDAEFKSE